MDEKKLILPAPAFLSKLDKLVAVAHFRESEIDQGLLLDIPRSSPEEMIVIHASPSEKRSVLVVGSHSLLAAIAHHLVNFPEKSDTQILLVGDNDPRKTAEEIILERFKVEPVLSPLINFSHILSEPESFLEAKQRKLQKFQSKKISPHKMRNT